MSELGIPVDIETSEINSSLNSMIFLAFLMGMYTMIYFGTIYMYFSKNSANHRLVPATITVIFLTSIIQTGIQWYVIKWQFINNGDTRDSVFLSLFANPWWTVLAFLILGSVGFVLADGLLIWRCFFVWDRSIRVISFPLLLIIVEAGLFLVQIILRSIFNNSDVSMGQAISFNDLLSTAYFMSFSASLVTTILIAYRIYSVSNQEVTSARRFKHVIDIVIQSGAVYSLSQFVYAMGVVLPGADSVLDTQITILQNYASCLIIAVTGMSSTILVARVAMLTPDTTFPSTSIHLSGLQFYARSTHQTNVPEEIVSTHTINVGGSSVGEGQEAKSKAQ